MRNLTHRQNTGFSSNFAGQLAEDAVENTYHRSHATVLARRARTEAGELDLILDTGTTTVFVEVKRRKSLADAAYAVSPRQAERIGHAASLWLEAAGRTNTPMRFDVALVDRFGKTEIVENAFQFDA